jgi:hypothetical protein
MGTRITAYALDADAFNSFLFLLDSLSACPDTPWVRKLTDGHRPHWLFSLLRAAREYLHLIPPLLHDLEDLTARLLRGYDCRTPAYPLHSAGRPPTPTDLPVIPADDAGKQMSVLSSDEFTRWLDLADHVAACTPTFIPPADWFDASEPDWDHHVRSMLGSFGAIRSTGYPNPKLVAFIG